jgi:hypothetical protein
VGAWWGRMKTMTQKFADAYSKVGTRQVLVAIYQDEAIVYAQVSYHTAKDIGYGILASGVLQLVESGCQSEDGLTWCWLVRRKRYDTPRDWMPVVMTAVSGILQNCGSPIDPHEDLNYVDNRHLDANTLEAFASVLGD